MTTLATSSQFFSEGSFETQKIYPLAPYRGARPPAPDWFVEALNATVDRRYVRAEGADIEVIAWGCEDAPGLLLLHGAMAHADWWSHIGPLLASSRRVVAMSFSGMGRSDWRAAYSPAIHAREAYAVAAACGFFAGKRPPVLVAHSFGAHAALRAAADWGQALGQVIVVDSLSGTPSSPPRHLVKTGAYPSREDALARFRLLPHHETEDYVLDWFGRSGLAARTETNGQKAFSWRFDPEFFIKHELLDEHLTLAHARCPVAFIRGERSTICTETVTAIQRTNAPSGTQFLTIAEGGHHLMADQPLRLVDAILGLIGSPGHRATSSQTKAQPERTSHDF